MEKYYLWQSNCGLFDMLTEGEIRGQIMSGERYGLTKKNRKSWIEKNLSEQLGEAYVKHKDLTIIQFTSQKDGYKIQN